MRDFKKILIMICVLALLTAGCVILAFATDGDDANVGSVAELSELIVTAERATDVTKKHQAVVAISEYLNNKEMDPTEEGYDDAILRIQAVAVEGAALYLETVPENVGESGNVDEWLDVFMNADELLRLFEIPNGTAGFSAVQRKYDTSLVKISRALIKDIGTDIANEVKPQTAQNKVKLNKANRVITYCSTFGNDEELINAMTEIKASFDACLEAHQIAVEKNLDALDRLNDVNNYDLPVYYEENFDAMRTGEGIGQMSGWSFNSNGTINRVGVREEKNGNKFYLHEYLDKERPAGSFIQRSLSGMNTEKGLVFEFSIAVFSEVPKEGILVETGSLEGSFPPPYLYINGNGDICSNDKRTVLLPNALTKGGWLDIIIAIDPAEFKYKLYVEGQHLATYNAKFENGSAYDHSKVAFRLSGGASTQGDVAYDNFKIYAGDNYRNQDRLKNMTDEEKFIYFVEYISVDSNPVLDRKNAYDRASEFIDDYRTVTNPETGEYEYTELVGDNVALKEAVDAYQAFDLDYLLDIAMTANLHEYVALVESLKSVERKADNVVARNNIVSEIVEFVKKNLGLINLTLDAYSSAAEGADVSVPNGTPDFEEYQTLYNKLVKQIEYDTNSSTFVKYMNKFDNATSVSATERYYAFAKALIDGDGIDLSLITNESTPYRQNFTALINAYDIYLNASKKVDSVTKDSNAKKIVQCMNAISHFRTEEQWETNRDEMTEYLNIVKDIVLGTDENGKPLYTTTYEGVDEAVRFFNRAYAYFYVQIQDEHVEYITYILGLITSTNDYVDKIGLVALVERYLDTNDVDFEDERIVNLLNRFDTYKEELVFRGEDYSNILRENSVKFRNLVEKMRTAQTYLEQVQYFEEAALLYFGLDTTVEGTERAIEIYDEYKVTLELIKESSVKFLEAVSIYNACQTEDDKFAALVDCYYNAQFAELSYEGVEEALAEYRAAYDAYMGYATAVNSDVTAIGNAVGSLRTNSGITTVVAIVIKKIFGI